jgi:hypothetical protein
VRFFGGQHRQVSLYVNRNVLFKSYERSLLRAGCGLHVCPSERTQGLCLEPPKGLELRRDVGEKHYELLEEFELSSLGAI